MTGSAATATVAAAGLRLDLRRAPLADIQTIDFRVATRDFWADEAALWDRLRASWAGLDDAAWRLPGAAPSDAGGPDWSLLDHVGHVAGLVRACRGLHRGSARDGPVADR